MNFPGVLIFHGPYFNCKIPSITSSHVSKLASPLSYTTMPTLGTPYLAVHTITPHNRLEVTTRLIVVWNDTMPLTKNLNLRKLS